MPSDAVRSRVPRRNLLAVALGAAGALSLSVAKAAARPDSSRSKSGRTATKFELDSSADQSAVLQRAIDEAARDGVPVILPPGRIRAEAVRLRAGSVLLGTGPRCVIETLSANPALIGENAIGVRLEGFAVRGSGVGPAAIDTALIELRACRDVGIKALTLIEGGGTALRLQSCAGRISACTIARMGSAAIWSSDAAGLEIVSNVISDCADNGILVWRSKTGEDATQVTANRIDRIGARSGGSGQFGNGVNVFRAGGVTVSGNRIADCAYSAVRANQASNVQIVSNNVTRIGEVALYAEFAFEGAVIASNIVDGAATGIAVTNFNEGGRLAVIQGNLVRNLIRREHEPVDKRGEGITVEADASVTGNTIEGAPTAGIVIGWGRHMRNVAANSNVIRDARVGIAITDDPSAGACLVTSNLISGSRDGGIRLMHFGRLVGGELARGLRESLPARIAVIGNLLT